MTRTNQQQLIKNGLTNKKEPVNQNNAKPKQKMSQHEIEDLMGIRRGTYKKVKGSFRQR